MPVIFQNAEYPRNFQFIKQYEEMNSQDIAVNTIVGIVLPYLCRLEPGRLDELTEDNKPLYWDGGGACTKKVKNGR